MKTTILLAALLTTPAFSQNADSSSEDISSAKKKLMEADNNTDGRCPKIAAYQRVIDEHAQTRQAKIAAKNIKTLEAEFQEEFNKAWNHEKDEAKRIAYGLAWRYAREG